MAYTSSATIWQWQSQKEYDDWLEQLSHHIPGCCWDDDAAFEGIVHDYLKHVATTGTRHKEWCDESKQAHDTSTLPPA